MKGKYIILAVAIATQGINAMSPAQEAQKKQAFRQTIEKLEKATTQKQLQSLKSKAEGIIQQLNKAGRPTKSNKALLQKVETKQTTKR